MESRLYAQIYIGLYIPIASRQPKNTLFFLKWVTYWKTGTYFGERYIVHNWRNHDVAIEWKKSSIISRKNKHRHIVNR